MTNPYFRVNIGDVRVAVKIPEETISQITQKVDIVDVISEYVQLKKQGRNYFGLCPFHGENTPSFSVSPDKQIFHCFGCKAGGNSFNFIMDIEGVSFLESVQILGQKVGIEVELDSSITKAQNEKNPDEQKMIEAHELLQKFYHHLLLNTKEGQEALEYLLNRGFTTETIKEFQIGWSLPNWDYTVKFLQKRGYSLELMEQAGLLVRKEQDQSFLDRFRGRVMFPLLNSKGETVAFSGRKLQGDGPKYLNSPETRIFNKSSLLYNYHQARSSIRRKQQAVLFEGFADVISASNADVDNGLATMGTSLTDQHIQMIRRLTDSIIVCYDGDSAGINAAFQAGNMLTKAGLEVRIAVVPEKLDPDDYIKKYGNERFKTEVLGSSLTLMAFKLIYYKQDKNLQDEGDRLKYIEEIISEIAKLDKVLEKDLYLRQLADDFSLSLEALQQQLHELEKESQKKTTAKESPVKPVMRAPTVKTTLRPAYETAERRLIAYMLKDENVAYKVQEWLSGRSFNIDEHQAIFTYILGFYEKGSNPSLNEFFQYMTDTKLQRVITEIEMMEIATEYTEQELLDYINQVLKHQKMLTIKEKEAEEKEADRQKDYKKAALIAMEILQLRKSL